MVRLNNLLTPTQLRYICISASAADGTVFDEIPNLQSGPGATRNSYGWQKKGKKAPNRVNETQQILSLLCLMEKVFSHIYE